MLISLTFLFFLNSYLSSEGWKKTVESKRLMNMLQNSLVYMSPEQTGRTTYAPDHRSDIYSLGIVFFTILTSKTPFNGGPLDILNGILSKKIPLAHELRVDLPEVISRIIEKMTNKVIITYTEITQTLLSCTTALLNNILFLSLFLPSRY